MLLLHIKAFFNFNSISDQLVFQLHGLLSIFEELRSIKNIFGIIVLSARNCFIIYEQK